MGLWCSLAITFGLGPDDPGSNPGSPTFFSHSSDDNRFKSVNHGHVSTKNHGHKLAPLHIHFSSKESFYEWLENKFTKHTITQTKSYFSRHLLHKLFDNPVKLYNYILSQKKGVKNLIVTARVYLNFSEQSNLLSSDTIQKYRKVLKCKQSNNDYFVPSDENVILTYNKIKHDKQLKIIYLILATSGIRYIECIKFLHSYDKSKFNIKNNIATYNISELRSSKKINNIHLPLFVFKELKHINSTYAYLRKKYNLSKPLFSLKYLRKWQYNFLLYNQVPESVADFIQGRASKSVSANHYLAKSQQSNFWYSKVANKLEELFRNNKVSKKNEPRSSYADKSHFDNFMNYS
jgi:intergrase/recombinase